MPNRRYETSSLSDSGSREASASSHLARTVTLVVSAFLLLTGAPALAAGTRVAVLPFFGPGASEIEQRIVNAVPAQFEVAPGSRVAQALARVGPPDAPAAYAAIARGARAHAIVEGRVFANGNWRLRLNVRNGASGVSVGVVEFRGSNRKELEGNVWRLSASWLKNLLGRIPVGAPPLARQSARYAEPPEAAPEASPRVPRPSETARRAGDDEDGTKSDPESSRKRSNRDERDEAASADEEDDSADGEPPPNLKAKAERSATRGLAKLAPPIWEVSAGPRIMSRALVFTDNVSGLPGYSLPGTVGIFGEGSFFPAARSTTPMRYIGFNGAWETTIGAKTLGRGRERSHATESRSYRVGPRVRIPTAPFVVTLGADYGEHRFKLDITEVIAPNVEYSVLRPNVEFRVDVGSGLSLGLTAAYLNVMSVGGLGDDNRFPRISAYGAEGGAQVGYAFDPDFEVRLGADVRHYAHNMHVRPGDPLIVGGAVDDYFGASLLITYRVR